MNCEDLIPLLPLLIVAGTAVIAMLGIAVRRSHYLACLLAFAGLAAAFGALVAGWNTAGRFITPLLVMDSYARFFIGLILLASMAVAVLSYGYLARQAVRPEEYYILLLLATLGSLVLAASNHFASFFLGLELLSISLYGMVAYRRGHEPGVEAGLKYLVLAGVSSAFLLFGMALVYAQVGVMAFNVMSRELAAGTGTGPLLLPGLGLIIVGIAFKLALVPFHLWTPDVYQGAPAPVTAFVATVSKGAMFALLLRFFPTLNLPGPGPLMLVFVIIAIASMIAGNLLALLQNNVKRLLAYSSIAHLGYLLVAFMAGGHLAAEAVSFYLVAYFAMTLGAFGVVTLLSDAGQEAETLEDYRGLAWRRPWLAAVLSAALLSLAGIPMTAGFLGKFYILATGVNSALWLPAIVLVVTSVIGLFYYLRLLNVLYRRRPDETGPGRMPARIGVAGPGVLAVATAVTIWLGVYPAPLIRLIAGAVNHWASM